MRATEQEKNNHIQVNETEDVDTELPFAFATFPQLDSMLNLFNWYSRYFCRAEIKDCRGFPVEFREEDFVHLVKITDKYGKEPKNRADTIRRIKAGEFKMFHGTKQSPANFSIQRTKDIVYYALPLIQEPLMIVRNWQPLGRANPGEAYIRNFGKDGRKRFRVLICGLTGKRRLPITMFPRQRFADDEILIKLWP